MWKLSPVMRKGCWVLSLNWGQRVFCCSEDSILLQSYWKVSKSTVLWLHSWLCLGSCCTVIHAILLKQPIFKSVMVTCLCAIGLHIHLQCQPNPFVNFIYLIFPVNKNVVKLIHVDFIWKEIVHSSICSIYSSSFKLKGVTMYIITYAFYVK